MSLTWLHRKTKNDATRSARTRRRKATRSHVPSLEQLEPRVLLSVANELFVRQAYRDLLGREAEPGGLNFWSGLLDRGLPPTDVVQRIDHSREYRTKEVESLYTSLLLRPADATGLDSWVGALEGGVSRDQVRAGFLSSREYFQTRAGGTNSGFLAAVYHDVLGRPIDPVGAAGWGALLGGGSLSGSTARWFVAFGVAGSTEARQDFVQALYPQFLHRSADGPGLQNFVAALNGGAPQEQVVATVVGSDEYFLKVTQSLPGRAALAVPGAAGQAPVPATFTMLNYKADYHSEIDFFPVDDGQGRIGSLLPSSPGYAAVALASPGRRVVFGPYALPGAVQTLSLPAGSFGGLLLVQNSTSDQLLAHNPADQLRGNPLAFFMFAGANPDAHFDHVRQPAANVYGFEDQTGGGDQDFIDRVVRVDFPLDVTPPVVTLTSPAPGLVTRTDVTVQGSATDDLTGVASVQAKLDNGALFNVNFDPAGNFSFLLHLPLDDSADAPHTVLVRATDGAGKTSESVEDSFTLDTTPPVIQLTSPPPGFKTRQNVTITGQVTDNLSGVASLQAQVKKGFTFILDRRPLVDVPFDAAGNFSFPIMLPLDGSADDVYGVTLFAADRAGNESHADTNFLLDTTPPVVTFTSPASNLVTNKNVTVSGQATDDRSGVASVHAKLDQGMPFNLSFDASGNFTFPVTLPLDGSADGPHTVFVSATDGAGNVSDFVPAAFSLKTKPPPVTFDLDPASDTSGGHQQTTFATVTLDGQTDPNAMVTLLKGTNVLATTSADASGKFQFTGVALQMGANPLTVTATDDVGNQGTFSRTFTRLLPACAFDASLTGWTVQEKGGSTSGHGTVVAPNGDAVMTEGDSFLVTLAQTLTVPSTPSKLTFMYSDLSFDTTAKGLIKDAFEVALLDSNGHSLVHPFTANRDSFFNISEDQQPALGTEATLSGTTVTLDLSGIFAGTAATLVFRLVNNDTDTHTSVHINCVTTPSPGSASGQLPSSSPAGASRAFRLGAAAIDFSLLSDVSSSFTGEYARTSFDQNNQVLYADLGIHNTGQYLGDTPLLVGIAHIDNPGVHVRDADGLMPDGTPYYDLSQLVANGTLKPGGETGFLPASFFNPDRKPFHYDLVFLGKLNQPPVITSTPKVEAIAGQPYSYAAAAKDPDHDPVTFSLTSAPAGMSVDPNTGLVAWNPVTSDIGNRSIVLHVEDGRGGSADQHFTVSVIPPPPNRPPVFTSTPVVDASLITPYSYQATASDPDGGETLTFSVVNGPQGLSVDAHSGLVTWTPAASQLGVSNVTLQVDDGRGATATQVYSIAVQQQPGNLAPLIVSQPVTAALVGHNYAYPVHAFDPDGDPLTYSLTAAPAGMSIDGSTGQITWLNIPSQAAGPESVSILVADNHGGRDTQQFTLTVSNAVAGSISGTVFSDLNGNGQRDDGHTTPPPPLQPITLVPSSFPATILDYHQPTNSLLTLQSSTDGMSLVRILPDGTSVPYADIPGLSSATDMLDLSAVQEGNTAGFTVGDVFIPKAITTAGVNFKSEIIRVTNGGATVIDPWITLPDGGAVQKLYVDRTGVFGDDLLALVNSRSGSGEELWRIDAAGKADLLASQMPLSRANIGFGGMITLPNDPATYGPLAGKLFVTTAVSPSLTVDSAGHVEVYPDFVDENTGQPLTAEWITIASSTENLFLAIDGGGPLTTASAFQMAPVAGQLILCDEQHSQVFRLFWDGARLHTQSLPFSRPPTAFEQVISMPAAFLQLAAPPLEPGLANWVVYLDQNGNGRRDPGEPFTTTDANGRYTFSNLPPGAYTVALEGQPGWKQTAPAEQTHLLTMAPGQVFTGVDFGTTQLNVSSQNRPPVLTGASPPSVAVVGQTYHYQAAVANPDGVAMTFDLPVKPHGMVINPDTGFISWLPTLDQAGKQDVIVRVQDDRRDVNLQQFSITVEVLPNATPAFTSSPPGPAAVGLPYQYQVHAKDADRDPLTYRLDSAPSGMAINPATGLVSWPSAALGYSSAVLADNPAGYWRLNETTGTTAKDSSANHLDGTYQNGVTLGVPGALPADPETAAGFRANENLRTRVSIPDSPALKPGQLTLEAWMNPSTTSELYAPIEKRDFLQDYGFAQLNPGTMSFFIQLNTVRAEAPIPTGQWSHVVGTYDLSTLKLYVNGQLAASLEYHGTIDYSPSPLLIGTHWTGSLAEVALYDTALSADQVRAHFAAATIGPRVAITAADGRGGDTTQAFNLPVALNPPNDPPTITSTPPTSVRVGGTYQYAVQATDPDGDPLTFALTKAPTGMTMDAHGLVVWRPASAQLGPNAFEIKVEDGRGGSVIRDATINVVPRPTNLSPTIVLSTPPPAAILAQAYEVDPTATNPAGAPMLWSLDTAPAGMVIDPDQGTIHWTPSIFQLGIVPVVIRVQDTLGDAATHAFTILVRGANVPPLITSTPPTQAYAGRDYTYPVQATDAANNPLTFSLTTAPAGMTIDASSGLIRWTPRTADVGSTTVTVQVSDGQGGVAMQTYTLVTGAVPPNAPPIITSTAPLQATVSQLYRYGVQASDPDGHALHFALVSGPARMSIDPDTGQLQWTPLISQVGADAVSLTVSDSAGGVARQDFTVSVIATNQPPAIASSPVSTITAGLAYHYDVQAGDPDGDTLTYALTGDTRGLTMDNLGRITGQTGAADVGIHHLIVTVTDSRGASITQPYDLTVTADTEAPKVNLSVSANPANVGSMVTFIVTATDNVGVAILGLTVGGVPAPLDTTGRVTLPMNSVGSFDIVATPTDAAGNPGTAKASLLVIDPTVQGAPTVALANLPNDGVITAPVDVIGTASDPNLLFYTLSVGAVDGGDFKEIFRGTTSVTNGVLGKLDPSMLANDSYVLRLTATNAGGKTASVDANFSVTGNLKLGNFTLSFTDLSVPVSGIPITVTRTYDTMNANTSGDFGFGWRLEFRDVRLRTSVPKTGDEANGIFNPFKDGTRVYVTLPGGKREGFTFKPTKGFLLGHPLYLPHFVPDPGVTDTLTPPGEVDNGNRGAVGAFGIFVGLGGAITLFQGSDGGYYNDEHVPYNPADNLIGGQYLLTTKDGTSYTIDAFRGQLDSVTDRNGNTLTFTDAGISSSTGQGVMFGRDPQGRIVSVTDPMGKQIGYQYDAHDDLVSVTDRQGNTTQFVYRTDHPHYLDHVIDPLGRTGLKTTYDDQGRLTSLTDAKGNTFQLNQNPGTSTETTTDALGNSSTYQYDDRANIVTEIDALGGITRRTFDANNNMLTETDPLGRTTSYTYDADGNVLTKTDPLGKVTRSTYVTITTQGGRPITKLSTTTDPLGDTTSTSYDGSGDPVAETDPMGNTSTISYDAAGNPTVFTDPLGNATHNQYDASGNRTQLVDPDGHVLNFTNDANGDPLSQTQPDGGGWSLTYNADGLPTRVGPIGLAHTASYNAANQITQATEPSGETVTLSYDALGNMTQITLPDGTTADSSTYDAVGNLISVTDSLGNVTRYTYDADRRLIQTAYPDGSTVKGTYDLAGEVVEVTDALGNSTHYVYDADGRQIQKIDVLGDVTSIQYDAAGRTVATTDPLGRTTRFQYDADGRQVATIAPGGSTTRNVYDADGRRAQTIDAAGNVTTNGYDAAGNLVSVTDALGNVTRYQYNDDSERSAIIDANGNVTRFSYDLQGHLIQTTQPDGETDTSTYNSAGELSSTANGNGQTIHYGYDVRGQQTSLTLPDGSKETYTYTSDGLLSSTTDANGTTKYDYDPLTRRLVRVTEPDGRYIRYAYDAAGHRRLMADSMGPRQPEDVTQYAYDALGRLIQVTDPQGGVTSYTYDADGNLATTTLPNGVTETDRYDTSNRLIAIVDKNASGATITSYTYTLDANGNRTTEDNADGSHVVYTYDALNRLTSEEHFDSSGTLTGAETYTYDAVGNVTARTGTLLANATFRYNGDNQLVTGAGSTYVYDGAGNLVSVTDSSGQVTRYSYDARGRLLSLQTPGGTITRYTYDFQGVWQSQVGPGGLVKYLVDAAHGPASAQVIRESDSTGATLRSYVIGARLLSLTEGGKTSYYLMDGLGSTRLLTDQTGAVTDSYSYSAYGVLLGHTGSSDNSFLFAGQQQDGPSGPLYLRARYYDPATGRFLSRDAFAGSDLLPLSLNKYLYTLANPVNDTDPSGNLASLIELGASLAIQSILNVSEVGVRVYQKVQIVAKALQAIGGAMTLFTIVEGVLHPGLLGLYFGGLAYPVLLGGRGVLQSNLSTVVPVASLLGYGSIPGLTLTAARMLAGLGSTMYLPGTLNWGTWFAYVIPKSAPNTVYLNPSFPTLPIFRAGNPLKLSQFGALVHEFAHLASRGIIEDIVYGLPSFFLPPISAYFNADNYRLAVQGTTFGILSAKQLADLLGITTPVLNFLGDD